MRLPLPVLRRPRVLRAYLLAKALRVRFVYEPGLEAKASWRPTDATLRGGEIVLGPRADAASILHEVGHSLYGMDCCREHDEFAAHGVGTVLARLLRVPYGEMRAAMDQYAGWTAECPRTDR